MSSNAKAKKSHAMRGKAHQVNDSQSTGKAQQDEA